MAYPRKKPIPARALRQEHNEETRLRIKAIKILDRLQGFALATEQDGVFLGDDGKPVSPMTALQAKIALALLDKVLPSLQTVEVTREQTKTYVLRAPEKSESVEDWLRDYGPRDPKTLS